MRAIALTLCLTLLACHKDTGDTDVDPADLEDGDGDGWSPVNGDCDDDDPDVHPNATEIPCDGLDNDCDGGDLLDGDGDGFDCVDQGGDDCDDDDASVNPNAVDVCGDGIDSDCDGLEVCDCDSDGHDSLACGGDDCDDDDDDVHPGATDTCYDGEDSDCGGDSDYDCDSDGDDSSAHGGGDCDDDDPTTSSLVAEICYDGFDQNCDGEDDYDCDMDGYVSDEHGGTDCDDSDPSVYPGADDLHADGVDEDCDGTIDEDAYCNVLWPMSNGTSAVRTYDISRDGASGTDTMTLQAFDASTGTGEVLREVDLGGTVYPLVEHHVCDADGVHMTGLGATYSGTSVVALYDAARTFLLPVDELVVGATWTYDYTASDSSIGDLWSAVGGYEVLGTDTITVTAGTFDVTVIENDYEVTTLAPTSGTGIDFDRTATATYYYADYLGLVYVEEVDAAGDVIETRELASYTGFYP